MSVLIITPINMGVFMNNLLLWSFNFESRRFSENDHQTSIEGLFFSIRVNLLIVTWVVHGLCLIRKHTESVVGILCSGTKKHSELEDFSRVGRVTTTVVLTRVGFDIW